MVQRLKIRDYRPDDHTGIDKDFSCDYMGSAEFEFGALPGALLAMRAIPDLSKWEPEELKYGPHRLWFVGPETLKLVAEEFFKSRFKARYEADLKERTHIAEALTGVDYEGRPVKYYENLVGWWCIDPNLEFALFKTKGHAKKFLSGLRDTTRR